MHVISKKKLSDFWQKHTESQRPLVAWFKFVRQSRYKTFHELRTTFPTVDKIGKYVVFNIDGNKFRLITVVHFNRGKVYVRDILTHPEHGKEKWNS